MEARRHAGRGARVVAFGVQVHQLDTAQLRGAGSQGPEQGQGGGSTPVDEHALTRTDQANSFGGGKESHREPRCYPTA